MFRPLRLADSDEVYFARFVEVVAPNEPVKYSLVGTHSGSQFFGVRAHFVAPILTFLLALLTPIASLLK